MINRKFLYIMLTVLCIILTVGFVWSIALNASATSHLKGEVQEYLDLIQKGDREGFYARVLPEDLYYWDGNGGPKQAERRDGAVKAAKTDADKFFDLIKDNKVQDFEVATVARFERVAGLVRFNLQDGFGEAKVRKAFGAVAEKQFKKNKAKEVTGREYEEFVDEAWPLPKARALYNFLVETLPPGKKPDEELKHIQRLLLYIEKPDLMGDHEYVLFLTREDHEGNISWFPQYYGGGKKKIREVDDYLLDKRVADLPKYPDIVNKLTKEARKLVAQRQYHSRVDSIQFKLKESLRNTLGPISKPDTTREGFCDGATPSFLADARAKSHKEFLGKELWDRFRPHFVAEPEEEPENPITVRASQGFVIESSIKVCRDVGEDTRGDYVGGVLKVLMEASRKRFIDMGKAIGKKKEWYDRRWQEVLYITMIRHVNPKTKEYRWLPVGVRDRYDYGFLKEEIQKELARRKALGP
jgi:hypothetical protein